LKHDGIPDGGGAAERSSERRAVSRRSFIKGAAIIAGVATSDLTFLADLAHASVNPIVAENALAGSTDWDLPFLDDSIEGFSTEFSVNAGETIKFKIKTPSRNYRIDIYRIGWYGGSGGRKIATVTPSVSLPQTQPTPIRDAYLGLTDCGNWTVSASWNVPASAVSGIYVANLIQLDVASNPANRILFVVRNDGRTSDLLVQTSDTTYQAYNRWGGDSLYFTSGGANGANWGRAVKVSYNRPMDPEQLENEFFYAELPLVRWLERNGYDVAYTSCIDTDRRPAELLKHKVFISSGHDEYTSGAARANLEAARDGGVHLIFMTGNEVFWRVRWEPSVDGTGTPYKTLVCYKETLESAKIDPSSEWTGTWRDPRFSPPSNGGRPENALTGTLFKAINPTADSDFAIKVPFEYSRLRIWRNTSIASIAQGTTATLTGATLGYEWDTDGDMPSRPAGLIRMSETTETANEVLQDYGKTYATKPLTHYLTMYRAPSGALVWGTGTVQWSWGLDDYHTNRPDVPIPVDVRIQQATLNVLADMGVQPATRQPNLVASTASADNLPPVSGITSPAAGATVPIGTPVVVSGTATDAGGGRVAGVEVSTDGGVTWHPAVGTSNWTYSFTPITLGPVAIRSRATDDSCNIEKPAGDHVVTAGPRTLPGSIWNVNVTPSSPSVNDPTPLELGLRFRASVDGFATGVRFYKGTGNTGTHTGRLWTNSGVLLGTVTFTNETATGWQTALFADPIALKPGVTYVVSYSAPAGHYAVDNNYFASAYDLSPLRALANNEDGANGVFSTTPGAFPTSTYGASNYWVDVLFDIDNGRAPTALSPSPAAGVDSVAIDTKISVSFNEAMDASSITFELRDPSGATVAGTGAYDATARSYTFTPGSALASLTTYTAKVLSAADASHQPMAAPFAWTFTTTGPAGTLPTSIWTSAAIPATESTNDPNPIEIGVKFKADVGGFVTAIRFYKGPSNGGTHLGRVWTAAGTLLGTVTFQNESATGWQQADFDTPVEVQAGQIYVVSCYCPQGGYAASGAYFGTSDVVRGPLRALASTTPGGNGVYRYGAGGGFPNGSYNRSNYWVDLMFYRPPDLTAPSLVDRAPAPGLQGVAVGTRLSATFDKGIDPASLSLTLRRTGGASVTGTVAYDESTLTATFEPSGALASGSGYTASVTATTAGGGAAMSSPATWSFATATAPGQVPATIWDTSVTPSTPAANDASGIEVGVKFRTDVDGVVTGIRFFKGTGNTGTHVGHLWAGNGTLLGTVVFTGETATGWQQANFGTPVPISANQTYVASYYAPVGRYAHTGAGLQSAVDRAPLHALASGSDGGNGVFAYGSGSFPTQAYNASNYWVDVVFDDVSAPTVTAQSPAPNATAVDLTTAVSATFSEPVAPATVVFELRDAQGALVAGSVAYDAASQTSTFTPTAALTGGVAYTASVSGARDANGNTMAGTVSWSFSAIDASTVSLFGSATPATAAANDSSPVELGMKFRATRDGQVLGVRFYKGSGNTGTHVGKLWTSAGTLLASVTFTNETSTGWQYAAFSSPVSITAGTTYVVSYYAPVGHYAANGNYFAGSDIIQGPLIGQRSVSGDPNGVYSYGAGGGFPTDTYNQANYWVDLLFA
jgi:hypothetical protein